MEYIDNSLDSAEELFKENNGKYPYLIEIKVSIDSSSRKVTFVDNCLGMNKGERDGDNWKNGLLAIVTSIGKSNKANVPWVNGQFGFGAHAYAACAGTCSILTTQKDMDHCLQIDMYRDREEVAEEKKVPKSNFEHQSGTRVILSNFENTWWQEVNIENIKREVETHFDHLLRRPNLKIVLQDKKGKVTCTPTDYSILNGKLIERYIDTVHSELNGSKITKRLTPPVHVYLKVTDEIVSGKRPVFVSKGRRIEEVQKIKSFRTRSKYSTRLWGHDNLTGFIEVFGHVDPTIARDDFKRTAARGMIYDALVEIEDEINQELSKINAKGHSAGFTKLQTALNNILAKLAKLDNLKFRPEFSSGNETTVVRDPSGSEKLRTTRMNNGGSGTAESRGTEDVPVRGGVGEEGEGAKVRYATGFAIEFRDLVLKRSSDGSQLRSSFVEGAKIIIYTSHADFTSRVSSTRQGELRLTSRLASYIASEIAIHYKDKFYEKRGMQPEVRSLLNSRKDLFADITEFVYLFEEAMQELVDKKLVDIEGA